LLSELNKNGFIDLIGKKIAIIDRHKLKRMAE
jgi:hypothetical protein